MSALGRGLVCLRARTFPGTRRDVRFRICLRVLEVFERSVETGMDTRKTKLCASLPSLVPRNHLRVDWPIPWISLTPRGSRGWNSGHLSHRRDGIGYLIGTWKTRVHSLYPLSVFISLGKVYVTPWSCSCNVCAV